MDTQAERFLQSALSLSADDRVEIAESLILSLAEEGTSEVEAAWADEIQRRIKSIDSGRVKTIPADEVMREMRERLNG